MQIAKMNPSKVMVAVDFSSSSKSALVFALELARHFGARIAIAHVVPGSGAAHTMFPAAVHDELVELTVVKDRVEQALRNYGYDAGLSDAQFDTLAAATSGSSEAEAIAQQARDYQADLVVVGSHGRTGLERLALGSVAEKVVRLAPCDVLVAREGPTSGPVVAAVDLGPASSDVLQVGARVAARTKSKLGALFALDIPLDLFPYGLLGPFGIYSSTPPTETQASYRTAALRMLQSAVDSAGVEADVHVVNGRPAAEIVRAASEVGAAILVCSTHARAGLARAWALGSVAEYVVRHAPCSVLVVRSEGSS